MAFDFDKELDILIDSATKTEEEKLAFSLGYNAGHTAATNLSYTHRASVVVDMIEKYAEQNGNSFVIGYLLGMVDTHVKIMNYSPNEEDDDNVAAEDNKDDTNHDIKIPMMPNRSNRLDNWDAA